MRLFKRPTALEEVAPTTQERLAQLDLEEQRWLGMLTNTDHRTDFIVTEIEAIESERAALTQSEAPAGADPQV